MPVAARLSAATALILATLGVLGLLLWGVVRDRGPVGPACPAPLPGWDTPQTGRGDSRQFTNWVTVRGRTIAWNDQTIDLPTLTEYANQTSQMDPVPYLYFDPANASDCAFATRARDAIARGISCGEFGCWQGSREALAKTPWNPDAPPFAPW